MKTCQEIYDEMLETFQEATGFSMADSADLAVRLYGAAAQLESLYAYCDWAVNQSFPQTAVGEYLDYHGELRGLIRKGGEPATGTLRFTVEDGRTQTITIPAGTVCTTAGLVRFVTAADCVISATATYGDVVAVAEKIGEAGNVVANAIGAMPSPPAGVLACINQENFSGGSEDENDEMYRARILDSYVRLPNGANAAFYEARAMAVDGVVGATVIPCADGLGTVEVVIAPETGLPTQDMIDAVQADLEAVREIAVSVSVSSPTQVTCNFAVALYPKATVSYSEAETAARLAISNYFSGKRLGKSVLLAEIGNLIYSTGLVSNYHITTPAADVEIELDELPKLGTITLTEGT